MKKILLVLLFIACAALAKGQAISRSIRFDPVDGKDSLDMALNSSYQLIEDSCATIIRHTRFDMRARRFHGRFTDVSKTDPGLIINEGGYNDDGLKDGPFIMRYPNGTMLAKGNFKNDKYDGTWNLFYETGKPKLIFEVKDGICTITDAWDAKGNKIVDKGNGAYVLDLDSYSWKGKLLNGKPDGTWKLYQNNDPNKTTIGSEYFKKSEFVEGENQLGKYNGGSRIDLLGGIAFSFTAAEKFRVGQPCGFKPKQDNIVDAHYRSGNQALAGILKIPLTDLLSRYSSNQGVFEITGDVSTDGHIINLRKTKGSFDEYVLSRVFEAIQKLPRLEPGTVNGKPVVQTFKIKFSIDTYGTSYSFQFLR